MKYITLLLFPVLLLCSMPAKAEKGFAVGGRFGTLGVGFEVTKALTKRTRLRVGANAFTFGTSFKEAGISYDVDLRSRNVAVIFDYHPLNGRFRVSAGVFYNKNEFDADAAGTLTVGGTTYANATLNANVSFDRTSPYIGIGWGNAVKEGKRLTHSFDLGVLYQGSPKVKLTATGVGSQADLNQEALELEDALDSFRYYPVISYGISFKF